MTAGISICFICLVPAHVYLFYLNVNIFSPLTRMEYATQRDCRSAKTGAGITPSASTPGRNPRGTARPTS
jgi:hypothetical protein